LPAAALDLRFTPEKGSKEKRLASRRSPSRLRLRLGGTRRTTDAFGEKKWGGAGRLRIENLSRVLDELEEAEVLSGTLRKVASTSSAETAFRWEKRQDYAILHADSIRSEGPWSATGAYSRAIDGKWLALLRGTYLGLPIGVAISPEGTSWKITSSERKKPSPAVTPVESPKPKRT